MLVVQLWEETDSPPPLHEVPGLSAADPQAVEEDWERLPLGAPEDAVGEVALEGGGYRAVLEFLEDTPIGSRSSEMARANVDERESVGQVSEGEEGGSGPP